MAKFKEKKYYYVGLDEKGNTTAARPKHILSGVQQIFNVPEDVWSVKVNVLSGEVVTIAVFVDNVFSDAPYNISRIDDNYVKIEVYHGEPVTGFMNILINYYDGD